MKKATATYVAPPGDNKTVETGGVVFESGKPVELNSYEHDQLVQNLIGNPHFDVTVGEDDKAVKPPVEKRRGRPSNADREAARVAAEEADKAAKEAAEKAQAAKEVADETEKAAGVPEPKAIKQKQSVT